MLEGWLTAEWLATADTIVSWDVFSVVDVVGVVCIDVDVIFHSLFRFDCIIFMLKRDEGYRGWSEFICLSFDWGKFGLDQTF